MPSSVDSGHEPGDEGAVAAHARGQHVGARRGRQRGEQHDDRALLGGSASSRGQADRHQRQRRVADRQQRRGERRAPRFRPPSCSPAPTAIRPSGSAARPMRCSVVATASGKREAGEVGEQPGDGAEDQRIAQQLAHVRVPAVARQRPDRGDVAERHAAARSTSAIHARPCGPPSRSASASAMNELKRNDGLRARRVQARVDAGPAAERVGQRDAAQRRCRRRPAARLTVCAGLQRALARSS